MTVKYQVVPFKRWHVAWLAEQGIAEGGQTGLDFGTLQYMEQCNSWTILFEGKPLMSGGSLPQWPGRHIGFAYLHADTGPHMMYITRQAYKFIRLCKGRIEFTVRREFKMGHRWARLLGFHVENFPGVKIEELGPDDPCPGLLERYGPEGEDHVAYVLFND